MLSSDPTWGDAAYVFLLSYIKTHALFIAEECRAASVEWGLIQAKNPKAWGQVFRRAAVAGVIRKQGYGISNNRHRSPTPLWARV